MTNTIDDLRRALAADPHNIVMANQLLAAEMRLGFDPLRRYPDNPPRGGWWSPRRGFEATHKPTGIKVRATEHEERSINTMRRRALKKLRVAVAFSRQPDLRSVGLVRDWSEDWNEHDAYLKVGRLRLEP